MVLQLGGGEVVQIHLEQLWEETELEVGVVMKVGRRGDRSEIGQVYVGVGREGHGWRVKEGHCFYSLLVISCWLIECPYVCMFGCYCYYI